jgi:hypothetical protein
MAIDPSILDISSASKDSGQIASGNAVSGFTLGAVGLSDVFQIGNQWNMASHTDFDHPLRGHFLERSLSNSHRSKIVTSAVRNGKNFVHRIKTAARGRAQKCEKNSPKILTPNISGTVATGEPNLKGDSEG